MLQLTHPGVPHYYFPTDVNGVSGGRYVDVSSHGIAYEAKVGYTYLSSRIKIQILKDAYLIETNQIDGAVWKFFRSDITGRVGASKPLLKFLSDRSIEYIIHE